MKLFYIIISLFFLVISSCIYLKRQFKPSKFTYTYDERDTGLDTLINIQGYYEIDQQSRLLLMGNEENPIVMFFNDGLFTIINSIYIAPLDYFSNDGKHKKRGDWGIYYLKGDTIKGQYISEVGYVDYYNYSRDIEFLIKPNNTLLLLRYKDDKETMEIIKGKYPLVFHPIDNKVDSTNWLMKRKWFYNKEK